MTDSEAANVTQALEMIRRSLPVKVKIETSKGKRASVLACDAMRLSALALAEALDEAQIGNLVMGQRWEAAKKALLVIERLGKTLEMGTDTAM